MPIAFCRCYNVEPAQVTTIENDDHAREGCGRAENSAASLHSHSAPASFFNNSDHVATRTCHTWSYHDATRDETALVVLHAHYSLHVEVGREESDAAAQSSFAAATTADSFSDNSEGLCGYTWELTWLPSPSASLSTTTTTTSPASAAHARFSFPRSSPLANSTLRGTGGVLFLSSRHVLIATEAQTSFTSHGSHRNTPACLTLDSFCVLEERGRNASLQLQQHDDRKKTGKEAAMNAALAPSCQWTRIASSVELPCPLSGVAASTVRRVQPLLVNGVQVAPLSSSRDKAAPSGATAAAARSEKQETSSKDALCLRVLYVVAALHTLDAGSSPDARVAETIFAGVADVCTVSHVTAVKEPSMLPPLLKSTPRHATTEVDVTLRCALPPPQPSQGLHRQSTAGTTSEDRVARLRPSDLLWVYVADSERNRQLAATAVPAAAENSSISLSTQLYGSVAAVLPCYVDTAAAALGAGVDSFGEIGGTSPSRVRSSSLLPSVPCAGFTEASPFGVVGVAADQLDTLAKEQERQLHQHQHHSSRVDAAVDDVLQQLLPSALRTVYFVELGKPVKHVSSAAVVDVPVSEAALPSHTSVLLFVCDGVMSRGDVGTARGLCLTEAPAWNEAVALATAKTAAAEANNPSAFLPRRVLPSRTLWRGVVPVTVPASVSKGEHPFARTSKSPAAVTPNLTDLPSWAAWLRNNNRNSVDDAFERNDLDDVSASWPLSAAGTALSESADATATVTTVESRTLRQTGAVSTVLQAWCFPRVDALAQEQQLTVWHYVYAESEQAIPFTPGGRHANSTTTTTTTINNAATAAVAACGPSQPPLQCGSGAARDVWESDVAEWVAAQCVDPFSAFGSPLASSDKDEPANGDAMETSGAAAACTYAALKVLWAYALLSTAPESHKTSSDSKLNSFSAAWPQVLFDVLRSSAADAAQHHSVLHVFTHAVHGLVSAGLASSPAAPHREAELAHMRAAAAVFRHLVLRTLIELDWRAGDANGRRCCRWMSQWFLGSGAAATAAFVVDESTDTEQQRAAAPASQAAARKGKFESALRAAEVEGRAMQVLLHLGTDERALTWLRQAVLLYTCRNFERPLELTLEDIVEASGVLRQAAAAEALTSSQRAGPQDGWSEDDNGDDDDAHNSSKNDDVQELRESMEYALLRMVQPETLQTTLQHLAHVSPPRCASLPGCAQQHPSAPRQRPCGKFMVRGLLSLADLHGLVCAQWTPSQLQDAAPLGFSFVCLCVDVALRAVSLGTTSAPSSTAAAVEYEDVVRGAVRRWQGNNGHPDTAVDPAPVYPLLSRNTTGQSHFSGAIVPFPFSLLPPLLTVYVWYHVMEEVCTALRLLPLTTADTQNPHRGSDSGEGGGDVESTVWWRRGQSESARLQAMHRGVCVLRFLTQDSVDCAEELFAAMQLVHGTHLTSTEDDQTGSTEVVGAPERNSLVAAAAEVPVLWWVDAYVTSWQLLLPLAAPPLRDRDTILLYRERCAAGSAGEGAAAAVATAPFADVMRVLHLVYASAGSGHVLRAQLWRATAAGDPSRHSDDEKGNSLALVESALQAWRTSERSQDTQKMAVGPLSAWVVQVWAHVLLCDPAAVTDVGMYEHVYAALAHTRQRVESPSHKLAATSPVPVTDAAVADVAFSVLRPCFLYAYPLLLDLAVTEELSGSPPGNRRASPAPPNGAEYNNTTTALLSQRYLQFNEPLVWKDTAGAFSGSNAGVDVGSIRPLEQLCAGEVCERVRRQLGRLVGLFEGPTALQPSGDRRFCVLARLLSLQPAVVDVAGRQRRLLRSCNVDMHLTNVQAAPAVAGGGGGDGNRDVVEKEGKKGYSGREDEASSSDAVEEAEEEEEEAGVELAYVFLSPPSAYATAASATAITTDTRPKAATAAAGGVGGSVRQPLTVRSIGLFAVQCEVTRRELSAYLATELLLTHNIRRADVADNNAAEWRLVATGKEMKAFINAVADAVEPLTQALVKGLGLPLYQSVVLLLVVDVLHQMLLRQRDAAAEEGQPAASPSVMTVQTPAPLAQRIGQWIRQVATPLYQKLSPEDQQMVSYVVSRNFAEEYLKAKSGNGHSLAEKQEAEKRLDEQRREGDSTRYEKTKVHRKWQQWRQQLQSSTTRFSSNGDAEAQKVEAAMLSCIEPCIAAEHRHVLHRGLSEAPSQPHAPDGRTSASLLSPREAPDSTTVKPAPATAVATNSASWMEAGSALRSTLISTLGATVAPRGGTQTTGTSTASSSAVHSHTATPQPAPHVTTGAAEDASSAPAPQAVAARPAVPNDVREEVALLLKEESFRRRQLAHQLLEAQQHDVFASTSFQHALVQLYLAMRLEKRRKELVTFALDQHDLICAFASREQQLVLDGCRRALRQAWIDYGERQRLALRRLLQEERDDRMGVEATRYADYAALVEAERAEQKLWWVESEGRRGIALLEEDARDSLKVAAAEAQVELARRAVEAEEAAYWQAEEEAWVREAEHEHAEEQQQQKQEGKPQNLLSDVRPSQRSKAQEDVEQSTGKSALVSQLVDPVVPVAAQAPANPLQKVSPGSVRFPQQQQQQQQQRIPEVEKKIDVAPLPSARPSQKEDTTTSTLFGTLSRWQTALRETVAPAPSARERSAEAETTLSDRHQMSNKKVTFNLPPSQPPVIAPQHEQQQQHTLHDNGKTRHSSNETLPKQQQKEKVDDDDDDWGWGSDSSADEDTAKSAAVLNVPPPPFVPVPHSAVARADKAQDVCGAPPPASFTDTTTAATTTSTAAAASTAGGVCVAPMIPLTSTRPSNPLQHAPSTHPHTQLISLSAEPVAPTTAAAESAATTGIPEIAPETSVGVKLPRKKKGLAATLLVEPITTTTVTSAPHTSTVENIRNVPAAAVTAAATNFTQDPEKDNAVDTSQLMDAEARGRPNLDDATPNPVRSILSAVEAAATETISKIRHTALPVLDASPTPPSSPSPEAFSDERVEADKDVPRTPTSSTRPVPSTMIDDLDGGAEKCTKPAAVVVEGWSDDEDSGSGGEGGAATAVAANAEALSTHTAATALDRGAGVAEILPEEDKKEKDEWGWSDDEDDADDAGAEMKPQNGESTTLPSQLLPPQLVHDSIVPPLDDDNRKLVHEPAAGEAVVSFVPSNKEEEEAKEDADVEDDGWGWSEDDLDVEQPEQLESATFPQPPAVSSPPAKKAAVLLTATDTTEKATCVPLASVEQPSNSSAVADPLPTLPAAAAVAAPVPRSGWSEDDDDSNDSFGSDIVLPAQVVATSPASAAPPPAVTDLQMQQLYQEELGVREQLINFL